ncbi:MAG: LysR family transcriptional regulator ArgP [Nocardioides sp.]|uniref:LysR family transcriptional regulator ArgP n=1 Tax=Nocardioides sp. TaxID=35761 RepID=UPI0039E63386
MRLDPGQLETLLVITEQGTFDAAAGELHLTPSAVSQRIRALERATGQVVVRRTTPCTATPAGEPLVRLARQLRLLLTETAADLPDAAAAVIELAVAVNADSLATWFREVLDEVATWPATALRLDVEDQAYSHDLLRRGDVVGAVTSEPRPVQGCTAEPLGRLRYTPAATPELVGRHRRGRGVDWARLPMVVFNEKDRLQDDVLAERGLGRPPVVHRVPSSADFHEAVRRGLGWGAIPQPQLSPDLEAGRLVALPGGHPVDVPLYWQRWRLDTPALNRLTETVRRAASVLS